MLDSLHYATPQLQAGAFVTHAAAKRALIHDSGLHAAI